MFQHLKLKEVHRFIDNRKHEGEGHFVRRSIHETDHVHLRLHIERHDLIRTGPGTAELRSGSHFVAADVVRAHVHRHVAVGEHCLAFVVEVIPHDPDRGVCIDPLVIKGFEGVVFVDADRLGRIIITGVGIEGEGSKKDRKQNRFFHEI